MAIHPQSNEIYLLAASGEVVILDQNGQLISRHFLPNSIAEPRLISFSSNGDLLATDASALHPIVLRLPWQKMSPEHRALVH